MFQARTHRNLLIDQALKTYALPEFRWEFSASKFHQVLRELLHHGLPIARHALAHEAHIGIPVARGIAFAPAPIGIPAQRHPQSDRLNGRTE
jgi:hypothetical protein